MYVVNVMKSLGIIYVIYLTLYNI